MMGPVPSLKHQLTGRLRDIHVVIGAIVSILVITISPAVGASLLIIDSRWSSKREPSGNHEIRSIFQTAVQEPALL